MTRASLCGLAALCALLAGSTRASARTAQDPLAPGPAEQQPGVARVVELAIEGTDPSAEAALLLSLGIKIGAPLDTREVREAVRRLHATAQFARVAAYLEEVPSTAPGGPGVKLVFVVRPVRRLVSLSFPGHEALADSVLHQTANLKVKTEFQNEALPRAAEAIRAAYFRIGYRHVRVQPVAVDTPEGIALELRIEENKPTRIAELEFSGELGLSREELVAAFKLGRGDVLSLAALDESVRSLRERYRAAGRLRAQVGTPLVEELDPARARITVPVEAGPEVRFHIRGNRSFTDSLLLARLGLDASSEEPLDAQVAEELASRLRRFYVSAGWFAARVATREMRANDGAVQLVFTIDEQQRMFVDELDFEGNTRFPGKQLRETVLQLLDDTIPRDPYSVTDAGEVERSGVMGRVPDPPPMHTRIEPERVFDPGIYSRALRQIVDLYKSQGYLDARAGTPRIAQLGRPGHVSVTIPITEGDRAVVSKIVIEGGTDAPAQDLDAAVVLRQGGAFSYLAAEEGRSALTQIFTRRGHLYARVEDEENFPDSKPGDPPGVRDVEVRYRIQEGPVVRVALIEVIGQRRTKEDLILDLIAVKPGDVLTPEVLDKGQQQLLRTGLFFSATLTPLNPEVAEEEKTLQVSLRERPTQDVVLSGGFSLADGPRATAQYIQGNLFGRNLTFSAIAKADYPFIRYLQNYNLVPPDPIERVVDLGLSVPRLYPLTDKLRGGVDLIHQRAVRASYQLTKVSTQLSTGLANRGPINVQLQYEIGYQQISHAYFSIEDYLAGVDPSIFRQPSGTFLLGSLRPVVTFDLRDDPGRPRSGFFVQLSGDYLTSLSSNSSLPINLFKLQGLLAGYVPLPGLASLLLAGRAGRVVQLSSDSVTPGDRRFFLGGSTTLRGFREDGLQPQDVVDSLHRQVDACSKTITKFGCSQQVLALQTFGTSDGGDQMLLFNVELRVPVAASTEVALFYDAGNLWLQPRSFVQGVTLRDAVGVGLRYATPIGRIAIDLGVNISPDAVLNEQRLAPYFSINTL